VLSAGQPIELAGAAGPKDAVPLARVRRALVVKLGHHGDVLLATPVLDALKSTAPGIEVDALVYDDTEVMLVGHPALAALHAVGRDWRSLGAPARIARELQLFRQLRARRYDLVVHLSDQNRGAWLARTLGARWSVAARRTGRFWAKSFSHQFAKLRNGRRHQVELNLDALRRIGLQPPVDRRVRFIPGEAAQAEVARLMLEHHLSERKFVHVHPASRWRFKCWPAESNAALIDKLAESGERIVLTAAPDPDERALIDAILGRTQARPGSQLIDLTGQLSIKALGELTSRARLFIGVDSMPMHLAAAMGTPTIALFGPSGDIEWGPWGVASRVVTSSHPCRPCGQDGCGGGKVSECLTQLPVGQVERAVRNLLGETR
jgi:heptosyltransferase-3